jgi:hypothetical protein
MSRTLVQTDLIITETTAKEEYRRRKDEIKTISRWGQRKLLFSELLFFLFHWNPKEVPNPLCVYVGAACGTHIPMLSAMFPAFFFHLYDPNPFDCESTDKITIFNEYFTDEKAYEYVNRTGVFLISDIRTVDPKIIFKEELAKRGIFQFNNNNEPIGDIKLINQADAATKERTELVIWEDMLRQQKWVEIIDPVESLLKFRLPYPINKQDRIVDYLKGIVYWQIYDPPTSTETRLKPVRGVSGKYETDKWSCLEYEQWCFYHNATVREKLKYINPLTGFNEPIDTPELMNDYDSTVEAFLLKLYFQKLGTIENNIPEKVIQLSRAITWQLNKRDLNSKKSIASKRQLLINQTVGKFDPFRAKRTQETPLPSTYVTKPPTIMQSRPIQSNLPITTRPLARTTSPTVVKPPEVTTRTTSPVVVSPTELTTKPTSPRAVRSPALTTKPTSPRVVRSPALTTKPTSPKLVRPPTTITPTETSITETTPQEPATKRTPRIPRTPVTTKTSPKVAPVTTPARKSPKTTTLTDITDAPTQRRSPRLTMPVIPKTSTRR